MPNTSFRFGSTRIALRYARVGPWVAAALAVLVGALAASWWTGHWRLLSAGGALITALGTLLSFKRLLRLGPAALEDELPPAAVREHPDDKAVRLNFDYFNELARRSADVHATWVGMILIVIGSISQSVGSLLG